MHVSGIWKLLREGEAEHVKIINRHSTLAKTCYVVKGGRMSVIGNVRVDNKFLYNGAAGVVRTFSHRTIEADIDHPLPLGVTQFIRFDKPSVVFGSCQYKRNQSPLKLAVATTNHDIQGTTTQ